MIRLPTAAWTGISNCWRGMSSLSFVRHLQPVGVRLVFVNDRGEGVDDLVVEQQVDLDEVGLLVLGHVVVEGGVSLRPALELVEEVGDDLRQWKSIVQFDPLRREVVHPQHGAAPLLAQFHDRPRVVGGGEHLARTVGSKISLSLPSGNSDGLVTTASSPPSVTTR